MVIKIKIKFCLPEITNFTSCIHMSLKLTPDFHSIAHLWHNFDFYDCIAVDTVSWSSIKRWEGGLVKKKKKKNPGKYSLPSYQLKEIMDSCFEIPDHYFYACISMYIPSMCVFMVKGCQQTPCC